MQVVYERFLYYSDEAEKLAANGWAVGTEGCDPARFPEFARAYLDPYHFGGIVAMVAAKEFEKPAQAMFEIERLLGADVIAATCQDGAAVHDFFWQEGGEMRFASGWECAMHMYGAPARPRDAAMLLQEMRKAQKA